MTSETFGVWGRLRARLGGRSGPELRREELQAAQVLASGEDIRARVDRRRRDAEVRQQGWGRHVERVHRGDLDAVRRDRDLAERGGGITGRYGLAAWARLRRLQAALGAVGLLEGHDGLAWMAPASWPNRLLTLCSWAGLSGGTWPAPVFGVTYIISWSVGRLPADFGASLAAALMAMVAAMPMARVTAPSAAPERAW